MSLIGIIVTLVVVGVILYLINLIPMDATIKRIIHVVVIVFLILWVVSILFPGLASITIPTR